METNKQRVVKILGSKLAGDLGDVIVDYITLSIPPWKGTEEAFFELHWPFIETEVDESTGKSLCSALLKEFNKAQTLASSQETSPKIVLDAPIKMSDLFAPEAKGLKVTGTKITGKEYLFGAAEKKEKKKKDKKDNFLASAPKTFFVSRETTKTGLGRDIHVDNVDIAIAGRPLVKESALHLIYGRRFGLVGRNGAGKSTLLRAISGRDMKIPTHLSVLHVEQEVIGDETTVIQSVLESDAEREELLKEEKALLAMPRLSDDAEQKKHDARLQTIYTKLTEIGADDAESKARLILSGLGFTNEMQAQTTKEFSGGWRMRVSLARALFCAPDVLLLDEPTNMLDVRAVLWLEQYLINTWRNTLLVVSHDREFLNNIATDIIHLNATHLDYYSGNYESFARARTDRMKNQDRMRQAQENQRKHIQKFIDRFRYNANRAALVQSRLKKLSKMDVIPDVVEDPSLYFTFPQCAELRPPIIQFKDVSFGYTPDKILFPNLNFSIDLESRIALVGENGQGKTTILNMIAGELEPTTGVIFKHPRLRLAKFSQHHVDQLDMNMSPVEHMAKHFPGHEFQYYRTVLGRYGISGDLAGQKIDTLSGGQKSRVMFAHMSLIQPQIMILDEVVNHLDIETVEVLAQALNDFNGGLVLISHDERLISLVCDEVWVVKNGDVTKWASDFDNYKNAMLKELGWTNA